MSNGKERNPGMPEREIALLMGLVFGSRLVIYIAFVATVALAIYLR